MGLLISSIQSDSTSTKSSGECKTHESKKHVHEHRSLREPKWLVSETCPNHGESLIFESQNTRVKAMWCKFCYRIAKRINHQTGAALGYGGSEDISRDEMRQYLCADQYISKHGLRC